MSLSLARRHARAQYPYHCLPVDAREAAASVRRTLEALCTQVETAERRALLLRKFNPETHRTLVVRKWRALRALLSMEMPDGAAWSGTHDKPAPDLPGQRVLPSHRTLTN